MRNFALIVVAAMLMAMTVQQAEAIIYKYVDDTGRMIFVDDESKIPPKYRQATSAIKEQKDLAPTEAVEPGEPADPDDSAVQLVDQASQLQAQQHAAQQEKRRAYTTPVMIRGNRILVPVEVALDDRLAHLNLLIDTGAATTVFHRKALLGMQLPAGDKVETQMAGGQTVTAEQIQFQYIEVGPFREQDARTLVIDPQGPNFPYDGILGMDFLQSHPYEVDTKHEQLFWKVID